MSADVTYTRLDSWKAIARYLKRDVRTVHRWEQHEGLPVRRQLHQKRATVWAVKEDLDVWLERRSSRAAAPEPPRVMLAVLPFENLTRSADEYFSDGLTEEMISRLGRLSPQTYGVIARTSVMSYKGTQKTIARIGEELRVAWVLEGSVRRVRRRIRVTAQLIRVRDQTHVWSRSYDRELGDVLLVQADVARRITKEIQSAIGSSTRIRAHGRRRVRPEVYEAYLRGMFLLHQFTPATFDAALAQFNGAIKRDPRDPLPWAGLAQAYAMISHATLPAHDPIEAFTQAKDAAQRALAVDDRLPEAHLALGEVALYYDWNWRVAQRALRRALALNGSLPDARRHHAWYLVLVGKDDEALHEIRRAHELDPLAPLFVAENAWMLWMLGRCREAIAVAERASALHPQFPAGWFVIGSANAELGCYEEAIAAHRKAAEIDPEWRWALGNTLALAGRHAEARDVLTSYGGEAAASHAWQAWSQAYIRAGLGDLEGALGALEAAFEYRHGWVPWLARIPAFRALHRTSGFRDLQRKLDLHNRNAPGNGKRQGVP